MYFFSGVVLLCGQFIEYLDAPFTIADGLIGSVFYMLTGTSWMSCYISLCILVSIFSIYLQYLPIYRFFYLHFAYFILAFCRCSLVICLFFCLFYFKYNAKFIYNLFSINKILIL